MPSYTVKPGDTLSGIASANGLGSNWRGLGYTGDPTRLPVGSTLNWGSPAAAQNTPPVAASSTPAMNEYAPATNVGPSLAEFYKSQLSDLGVPDLQKTVQTFKDQTYKVSDLLNNLKENISSRTRGSLTSQAQNDRMEAVEGGDLRNQLSKLGVAAQPATDALSSALGLANTMTGFFSQDKQQQLSIIMDKIHRGQALTDQEKQQANDLAKMAQAHAYAQKEKTNNQLDIGAALKAWQGSSGSTSTTTPTAATAWNPQSQGAYLDSLFSGSGNGVGIKVK